MPLPSFFVAGVPKAGTTALHVALDEHPGLYLSPVKEPKYFLTDGPVQRRGGPGDARTFRAYVWRPKDYEALFAAAPEGVPRGESTPFYLYDPRAHQRIRAAVPDARFIVVLRDPVDRAHSNWAHLRSAGLESEPDFLRACHLEPSRAAAGWALFWRYLDLGRYGEQLARLYETFPRDRVLVLRYRELRDCPAVTLDRICAFLGVATGLLTDCPVHNVTAEAANSAGSRLAARVLRGMRAIEDHAPGAVGRWCEKRLAGHLQRDQRPRQPLAPEQRAALLPHFENDIRLLERLTGNSYGDWLDPRQPTRRELRPVGRIGTAFGDIDRPGRH